jgi:diaminopimelate decarboxylase
MTQALSPNAPLIGQAGSRCRSDTPALLIDLDALERNIAAMAAHARAVSVALRPHAQTHKSVRIARMQVDAGAIGICCATLGEAEVMVDAGIPGARKVSRVGRQISSHKQLHRSGRGQNLTGDSDVLSYF